MHVFADYHTHTRYSHGTGTVADNVRVAFERGLEEVAISDHGPAHMFGIGVAGFHVFDQIRYEVQQAQKLYPTLKILVGVESNVTSIQGDIDIPPEKQGKVDILQVGLHLMVRPENWLEGMYRYGIHYFRSLSNGIRRKSRLMNTEAIVNAVHRHPIHVITHPGHRMDIDTRALARACVARNTALEINSGHDYLTTDFLEIAASEGVKFVIGSDAHTPQRVGDFSKALEWVQRVGLSADQIINARA